MKLQINLQLKGFHYETKNIAATVVIIAILIGAFFIAYTYMQLDAERSCEMADLQAMRGAEVTAMTIWKDKLPDEPVEYWYSPDTFELIEVSGEKPEAYGLGVKRSGGAMKDFQAETGQSYDYSENEDYRDKVIHVVVDKDDAGKLRITMNWE